MAVLALPLNAAVIVPALKFPLASRFTIVEAVLALVAVIHDGAFAAPLCNSYPAVPTPVEA